MEGHKDSWKDCKKCLNDFKNELEMYVWYGTNEYNFEKLLNPPKFEPTYCAGCKKIISLSNGGYGTFGGKYVCDKCINKGFDLKKIDKLYYNQLMTQEEALRIMKTGANVFLTGEPGAGKTYTINKYVAYLREHEINHAITASTGIAATHINGMTIHSWSGIGIKETLNKYDLDRIASSEYVCRRVRKTKVLIIDEISMLRAETLSMVDAVCREIKQKNEPFGGMQVILVGDFFNFHQLKKEI